MTSTTERLHNSENSGFSTANPRQIEGLDISPADEGYIIYQPDEDRVHFLNPTAVLILELCNGRNSMDEIVKSVEQAYDLPDAPVAVVLEALTQLKAEGLLL